MRLCAWRFAAIEHLKNGTELIGSHTRVKVVKNKVAPPFKQAEFDIMYGEGISRTSELVDLGVEYGILQQIRRVVLHGRYPSGSGP